MRLLPYLKIISKSCSALLSQIDRRQVLLLRMLLLFFFGLTFGASQGPSQILRSRPLADTVGFATQAWQLDSLLARIWYQSEARKPPVYAERYDATQAWKVVISPHDDYAYVGALYPQLFQSLRAKVVIIFGVAHRARLFNLENQLVFDSFPSWHGVYQPIKPHPLREYLMQQLPQELWQLNDSLQTVEHSVEALLPFVQHFNRQVSFVSVLVPAMPFERMQVIAQACATAIATYARQHNWQWGQDFALVISNDAVHYGDEDWGGKNYAPYGCTPQGYQNALTHEKEIIERCLTGELALDKIRLFTHYTIQPDNFREYQWTWCGRYSVPLGLLVAYYLQSELQTPLRGHLVGYATSISAPITPVTDLRMGLTAPANLRHWVGYAAIGYY